MMSIFTTEKLSMDKMKKPKLGSFPARSLLTAPHFGFSPKGFVSKGGMAEAGLTRRADWRVSFSFYNTGLGSRGEPQGLSNDKYQEPLSLDAGLPSLLAKVPV